MFTLKISTANEAFDNEGAEIARILRDTAHDIEGRLDCPGTRETEKLSGMLRDVNGNTVGKWELR